MFLYLVLQRRMILWTLSLIFSSLSSSILVCSSPTKHLCRLDQKDALLEFKSEFYVQSPDFHLIVSIPKTESWRNKTDCCYWDGISCDLKTGNVVKLDLIDSFLNGPLRSSSSLFRLQHLQSLDLGGNNLSGILPDTIDNLKYLRVLHIDSCNLFGKLPSSLGNLSYLTDLNLIGNDFTGELPDSMGNLNHLTVLQVVLNKLSGSFPLMLLNLSELYDIDLNNNKFEGMLPSIRGNAQTKHEGFSSMGQDNKKLNVQPKVWRPISIQRSSSQTAEGTLPCTNVTLSSAEAVSKERNKTLLCTNQSPITNN